MWFLPSLLLWFSSVAVAGGLTCDPNDFAAVPLSPIARILKLNLDKGPRDLTSAVRFWCRTLDYQPKALTRRLLERAQALNMKLQVKRLETGTAHFDGKSNCVVVDADRLIGTFHQRGAKVPQSRVIDEVIAHEIIHGLIHARVPCFDYTRGKAIARDEFEKPLLHILAHLPTPEPGSRESQIMANILRSHPQNRPEEVITYALTDPDFEALLERSGQAGSLRDHLRRFGFEDLLP